MTGRWRATGTCGSSATRHGPADHPGFHGSYSIKAVLPAVVPHLAYDDLENQEGTMAALQFHRMSFGDADPAELSRLRTALLRYCERDTLAMVEVRRTLVSKARSV